MKKAVLSASKSDFDFPAIETLITRKNAPEAKFTLLGDMFVERGSKDDWDLLHDLHYKAESLPMGPRFWKLTLADETIGVLVTAVPKGLLKERHIVFPKLKPTGQDTKITNTWRYKFINNNFRVVSRFVVDTKYRGIGAGYRMMNLVSRMEGAPIMEIQSSMSKFNYFGQKAGFRFVRPINSNMYERGMKFFRLNFSANPGDYQALIEEIEARPKEDGAELIQRCRDFYYSVSALEKTGANRNKGQDKVNAMSTEVLIKQLQQVTLASPMYGVWKNPDFGKEMPERLPLLAFDWQKPTEPLRMQDA